MISVAAFETVYVNNPNIDIYIFVSTDSDFSVIMDKLRKYGKEVWLFAREQDVTRRIFNNSCDRIFAIQRVRQSTSPTDENAKPAMKSENSADNSALVMMVQELISLDEGVGIQAQRLE